MNTFKKINIAVLLGMIICLLGCDEIDYPYKEPQQEAVLCDTPSFPALGNVIQKYLIEDFTGHTCVNCPEGHKIVEELLTQMKDTLVAIGIHSGTFAIPETAPYNADYRTNFGDAVTKRFGVSNYPSAMISRKTFDGEKVLGRGVWKSKMASVIRTQPELALQIIPLTAETGELCVFIKTSFLAQTDKNLRLYTVLVEDSIVSAQKGNRVEYLEYVHKHVLRTHIGSTDGTVLTKKGESVAQSEFIINGYSFTLNAAWTRNKCSLVSFICDMDTEEILQLEYVSLSGI